MGSSKIKGTHRQGLEFFGICPNIKKIERRPSQNNTHTEQIRRYYDTTTAILLSILFVLGLNKNVKNVNYTV